jgi:DNA-directed RNA polymerase specialized sigma24 family protein
MRTSFKRSRVIELHYFAGLSQTEVAAAVDTSENAIALRLSRVIVIDYEQS